MIKLPNKLSEFDNYVNKPFCIFEKKNFLEESLYNQLRDAFPSEDLFPGIHSNGKKIFLNNRHLEFYKFIKKNIWGDFYDYFNKKEACLRLINLIRDELNNIENRKKKKDFFFIKNYQNNLYQKIIKKILQSFNTNSIRLGFEFSVIKKNCFIPPHCDTENKLLSLMVYFPPKEEDNLFENYKNIGTNFYKISSAVSKNFDVWESEYLDHKSSKSFFENYELFYQSKFEKNKLTGFIKNDKSWHDVKEFNDNLIRKSLNINLFII